MELCRCCVIFISIFSCVVSVQNIEEIVKRRKNADIQMKKDVINGIKSKVSKLSSGLARLPAEAQVKEIEKIRTRLRETAETKEAVYVINTIIEGIKSQLNNNASSGLQKKTSQSILGESLAAHINSYNDDYYDDMNELVADTALNEVFRDTQDYKTKEFSKKMNISASYPKMKKIQLKWLEGAGIESQKSIGNSIKKKIHTDKVQSTLNNRRHADKVSEKYKNYTTIKMTEDDKADLNKKTTKVMNTKDKISKVISKDKKCGCRCQTENICTELEMLGVLECGSNNENVPLKKLCDGVYDCKDSSDELYCPPKAVEKIKSAKRILSQAISIPTRCLETFVQSMLLSQNKLLGQTENATIILQGDPKGIPIVKDRLLLERTANEAALVVNTVAIAMDGGLCMDPHIDNSIGNTVFKDKNILDDELELKEEREIIEEWSIKDCGCSGNRCFNEPCSDECHLVCVQKYNLQRFECQPIVNSRGLQTTVSLDLLCDGKMDCGGATDENDCVEGNTYGKFQANTMFNDILKMLALKMTSNDYKKVEPTLKHVYSCVADLQKIISASEKPNITSIKVARDRSFRALAMLYIHKIDEGGVEKLEDVFSFLKPINELLVTALKYSHSGNEMILSSNKCFCQDEQCGTPFCPYTCERTCAVEKRFTRAVCENNPSPYNNTIPVEDICDGKWDCENGDDEASCSKDLCQKYHFRTLAKQLEIMGNKDKGNLLGEIIRVWKSKVISKINIILKSGRPTRKKLNAVVRVALDDLVKAYASLDANSNIMKQGTKVIDTLEDIAKEVITVLQRCAM